jgi:hypothetical protein
MEQPGGLLKLLKLLKFGLGMVLSISTLATFAALAGRTFSIANLEKRSRSPPLLDTPSFATKLSAHRGAAWDFREPKVLFQDPHHPRGSEILPDCVRSPLIDVRQGNHRLAPLILKPKEKLPRQLKIGVRLTKKSDRLAGIELGKGDASLEFLTGNLTRLQIIDGSQHSAEARRMFGQLVCNLIGSSDPPSLISRST